MLYDSGENILVQTLLRERSSGVQKDAAAALSRSR
jgi:hypothetical protein